MGDELDKIAGQIGGKQPSQEEVEDALKLQAKRQQEMQEQMQAASKRLESLMETQEMQRIGWAVQFGYQVVQWAQMEAAAVRGMDEMTIALLMHTQAEIAQSTGFDFGEVMKDFEKKQLRWFKERIREGKARRISRERQIERLKKRLRRKDIPLPVHSLRVPFGDAGFTYEDSLTLLGESEGVRLVLRYIALEYQRAGGTVLFLTANKEAEPKRIAKLSMTGIQWINCCQIFSRLIETLDPFMKSPKDAPGLVIVETLDRALSKTTFDMARPNKLQQAFGLLKQYQQEHGFALIVGINTDDDPVGIDPTQIYPPLLMSCPLVPVKVEKSQLVDWSHNVCIGNDVITCEELKKLVEGTKEK